jgi:hypothetical protein
VRKIIGISGKAGSGKDHLGKLLRRYGYQNVGFAWPLKMAAMDNGYTYEEVFVSKPPHVRKWLQEYGVSKRREDPLYWIKRLNRLIHMLHSEGGIQNFVITDMRFPNEYDYVKAHNGKTIRLLHGDRPYPLEYSAAALHESETALDRETRWDLRMSNNLATSDKDFETALYAAGIIESRGR